MTINTTRLGIIEQWLAKHGLTSSLMFFTDPDCGTATGKIYDLGTTRLPALGDFNIGGGTTINATGVNSRPAWVNASGTDQGYWGNGRYNNIRRKRQITFAVLYERTQTTDDITLIGTGPVWGATLDGSAVLAIRHTAGTPGTVQFILSDDTSGAVTATVTAAASSGPLVAICTYDGTDMVAYSGISGSTPISAGTANSSLDPNPNWATDIARFDNSGGDHVSIVRSALAGARGIEAGTNPYVINVGGFGDKAVVPTLGSGAQHIYNFTGAGVGPFIWPEDIQFEEAEAQFKAASVLILEMGIDSDTADDLRKLLFALPGTTSKNLITHYSAAADGSTDDSAKFNSYAVDALADFGHDQELTLTTGHNFFVSGLSQFWTSHGQTEAIRKLTVNATGATVTVGDGGIIDFGGGNIGLDWSTQSALIESVDAPADRVTLITPSDASRFVIGDYVMVAGLQVQFGGDPPNFYFFEFVKIVGIAGDTIMFDRLRNTYKSTWPAYGSKSAGPACIARCTSWDSEITFNGGTYVQPNGGHTKARKHVFNGTTFDHAYTPTGSDIIHLIGNGGTSSTLVETDKLISVNIYQDGVSDMVVKHQSASPALTVFDNYELTYTGTAGGLNGTGKHTWIRNGSNIARTQPGSFYGVNKSITAEDSNIDRWDWGPASIDQGSYGPHIGVQNAYTITAGVIRIPIASIDPGGGLSYVPGAVYFFGGTYPYQSSFKVLDVRTDGTYVYVDTNLSISAFPDDLLDGSGFLVINAHPCPRLTVNNCTGTDGNSLDYNGAPDGAPLGTYSFRTYTESNLTFAMGTPLIFGRVQELRFNVIGANAVGSTQMMQLNYIKLDGTTAQYKPFIDLSTPGERVVVPGSTTTLLGSDSALDLPTGAWFPGGADSGPSGSVSSGTLNFTIQQTTDQEATADPDTDELPLYAIARAQLGLTVDGEATVPEPVFRSSFRLH